MLFHLFPVLILTFQTNAIQGEIVCAAPDDRRLVRSKLQNPGTLCTENVHTMRRGYTCVETAVQARGSANVWIQGYGSRGIEVSTGGYNSGTQHNVSGWPYFEYNVSRNVTAAVGQTAFLHCRVEQLGDKAVSWIRKRDLHILTAGILTYTSDQRFQVIRPDKSENWTLQIKFPQERDSGIYECQVNTEPKMSLSYRLNVVEARARIIGPADVYVKTGSLLTLTCLMSQGPHDLGTVAWYHGSKPVLTSSREANDVALEPRVAVDTEWSDALTSRLKITHARLIDSGNYSCVPTVAESASVTVHVINGEHPAAMQHGNTAAGSPTSRLILVAVVFLLGQLR